MPKCVKCNGLFPPQLMKQIDGAAIDIQQCVFCFVGKDSITLPVKEGMVKSYTRQEAKEDYVKFLKMLKEKLKNEEDLKKFLKGELQKDGKGI
jgi:hypothetical protein